MELVRTSFSNIKDLWRGFYSENSRLSPYSSYEFAECYKKFFHFGFKRAFMRQEFFLAKENDDVIAIVPLIKNRKDYYLFGDLCSSGYLDFIYNGTTSEREIAELLNCIEKSISTWGGVLHLNKINERSMLFPYLQQNATEVAVDPCVNISFEDIYEEYFKSLGKSIKQNVRTAYNRMNREGKTYRFEIYIHEPVPANVVKQEMDIYHKREEHRNKKKTPVIVKEIRQRFNPISLSTTTMENAVHACFYIDNTMAAFLSGYITNDNLAIVVPRHAINDDFKLYCAGALLITETIKYCINETCIRNLDLSRGDEKYKYTLGGKNHYNHSFIFA